MFLTTAYLARLHKALVAAFTRDNLRQLMALCMAADFDHIAPEAGFADQVFELVQWARQQGRVEELVKCAHEERPKNEELAALFGEIVQPRQANENAGIPLRQWVLVAGTGRLSEFTPALAELCTYLGSRLAREGFRLVTGGWQGVDETVGRSFAATTETLGIPLEDRLIQVVLGSGEPAFTGGTLVFAGRGEDYSKPVALADLVLLVGGVGGTLQTGEVALRQQKHVLPLADSGGDAKKLYIQMLRTWERFAWMNIRAVEFQRLARPHTSGVDAAIALMLNITR